MTGRALHLLISFEAALTVMSLGIFSSMPRYALAISVGCLIWITIANYFILRCVHRYRL